MFGKNPDLYKLEDIIVCIKTFTGYYPTAHPIFVLEKITSGKWENFQLIPLPWNISKHKGILRLFPAKKWTSCIHDCKPKENLSSNNEKWVKFKVQVVVETRLKVVLKGSFFPWRKVKPAQLTAIHSHSIQPLQALGIHYKFVVYFYKTNYILDLPFVLDFEKKWTLVELTILRYIIDGMKLQTSFLKGLQLSSEICWFLQISIFWQLPGEETA